MTTEPAPGDRVVFAGESAIFPAPDEDFPIVPEQTGPEAGPHFQLYRTTAHGSVRWRLLGGNNRPIGRSALDHPDVPECLAALTDLLDALATLTGRVERQPPNLWIWRLALDGEDLAYSAHPYDRQIRSQHAMAQFLTRAAVARVDAAVMVTGTRRWRSVSRAPLTRAELNRWPRTSEGGR